MQKWLSNTGETAIPFRANNYGHFVILEVPAMKVDPDATKLWQVYQTAFNNKGTRHARFRKKLDTILRRRERDNFL